MTPYTLQLLEALSQNVGGLLQDVYLRRKLKDLYAELNEVSSYYSDKIVKKDGRIDIEKLNELKDILRDIQARYYDIPSVGEVVTGFATDLLSSANAQIHNLNIKKAETDIATEEKRGEYIGAQTKETEQRTKLIEEQTKGVRINNELNNINLDIYRSNAGLMKKATEAELRHKITLFNLLSKEPYLIDLYFKKNTVDPLSIFKLSLDIDEAAERVIKNFEQDFESAYKETFSKFKSDDVSEGYSYANVRNLLDQFLEIKDRYSGLDQHSQIQEFIKEYERSPKDSEFRRRYKLFYDFATAKDDDLKRATYSLLGSKIEPYRFALSRSSFLRNINSNLGFPYGNTSTNVSKKTSKNSGIINMGVLNSFK